MNMQIRVRVPQGVAKNLLDLCPRQRANAVGLLLSEKADGIDLQKLLQADGSLIRIGVLLNQSLRTSGGRSVDLVALQNAIKLINSLQKK